MRRAARASEALPALMDAISVQGLIKDYDGFRAVKGIDLLVPEGESFGVLGPNGAGKTTVMGIIHCFMPPTEGGVRVLDMDVAESPSEIKRRLGVMPQEDNLDPDLSSLENLIVYARYFDIPSKVSKPRAAELLKFVELEAWADKNIKKLSGGMRRRLQLARALINEPELIVLDEPTTGMDPHGRRSVWQSLENLKAEGRTILLTTHYMEEADRLCDRVAIMDQGRIIALDTPRNLKDSAGARDLEEVYLKLTGRRLEN
jgi:lipooligosaccharide transport system ATP-binding protein